MYIGNNKPEIDLQVYDIEKDELFIIDSLEKLYERNIKSFDVKGTIFMQYVTSINTSNEITKVYNLDVVRITPILDKSNVSYAIVIKCSYGIRLISLDGKTNNIISIEDSCIINNDNYVGRNNTSEEDSFVCNNNIEKYCNIFEYNEITVQIFKKMNLTRKKLIFMIELITEHNRNNEFINLMNNMINM